MPVVGVHFFVGRYVGEQMDFVLGLKTLFLIAEFLSAI